MKDIKIAENDWLPVSGGISWDRVIGDEFMITLVFYYQEDFREFKKYLKKISKSNVKVSVVEHKKKYSVLFFEDPKKNVFPKLAFVWPVLPLSERYKTFRDNYDGSKMRFAYAQYTDAQHSEKSIDGSDMITIDPTISPFKIKQFNIIKESELKSNLLSSGLVTTSNDFKYAAESVLTGLIKNRFK